MSADLLRPIDVHRYLVEQGWQVGKSAVYNHCRAGVLKAARGGGYRTRDVDRYAGAHLRRAETGQTREQEREAGSSEERLAADARLKNIQAARQELRLGQERGELVATRMIEDELGARARALRLGLGKFLADAAGPVVELLGGSFDAARDLATALGLPEARAALIVDWAVGRTDLVRRQLGQGGEDLLDSYATGVWWTEEMRAAWERLDAGQAGGDGA